MFFSFSSFITNKRKWYLYNKIREYCFDSSEDFLCPCPTDVTTTDNKPYSKTPEPEEDEAVPNKRRKVIQCSLCDQTVHNCRICLAEFWPTSVSNYHVFTSLHKRFTTK